MQLSPTGAPEADAILGAVRVEAAVPQPRAAPPLRRVLVVDDNQDAADTLTEFLRFSGYEVETAYTGTSALTRVREFHPDVVLCDLNLPELSGYDIAKAIRSDETSRTKLVAISGYAQPEDIRRSRAAGFDAHLAKPAEPSAIENLLS
jgi:CheY-like chemotaxis protein